MFCFVSNLLEVYCAWAKWRHVGPSLPMMRCALRGSCSSSSFQADPLSTPKRSSAKKQEGAQVGTCPVGIEIARVELYTGSRVEVELKA